MVESNATVEARLEVSDGLMILRVRPDGDAFSFKPGQYTVLGLQDASGRWIRRAYSIASANRPGEPLEFYVALVNEGALTPLLFNLQVGDRLYVSPKAAGLFTLDRIEGDKDAVLVATGTGLAPYMSMLRSQMTCGIGRRFVVLHGARFSWELGYRGALEILAKECKNFFYLPSITRPKEDPSWNGLTGYLQDLLVSGDVEKRSGIALLPERTEIFLCGNPAMIQAASDRLIERGFVRDQGKTPGTLHIEEYW